MKFLLEVIHKYLFLSFILLCLTFNSCRSYKAPELRRIDNVRLRTVGGDQIELYAQLVFYNPNEVKIKLKSYQIEVYLEDKKITELKDNTKMIILPKDNFKLNTIVVFSLGDFEGNILTSAIGLLSKRMQLRFEGNIKLSRNGVRFTIPIHHREKVKFK